MSESNLDLNLVKEHNKKLAKKVKDILKDLGHDIPLGHAYELISRMDGFQNWDTASASGKKILYIEKPSTDPIAEDNSSLPLKDLSSKE